jgi:hypothetical protein
MIGGNIDLFEANQDSAIEIGRGGYGIVYLDSNQSNNVFKVSSMEYTCRQWSIESTIYQRLNNFNIDTEFVKVLKMMDYKNDGYKCIMELTRVINPLDSNLSYTIQPLFGFDSFEKKYLGRGLFLGLTELYNHIFEPNTIQEYIRQLGIVMARLHYYVKNDCYDIELFVSKINNKIEIFVGDFDLSIFITDYDNTTINRIIWSLNAVEYFPHPNNILFENFYASYIDEATKYNKQTIAEYVMSEYKKYNLM